MGNSRAFYVTTTRTTADLVRQEILRLDALATLQYRRENKTLLVVTTAILSEEKLETIPGVSHAVSLAALGFIPR